MPRVGHTTTRSRPRTKRPDRNHHQRRSLVTWKERTIAKILLLLAQLLSEDPELTKKLQHLATEINMNAPKSE